MTISEKIVSMVHMCDKLKLCCTVYCTCSMYVLTYVLAHTVPLNYNFTFILVEMRVAMT